MTVFDHDNIYIQWFDELDVGRKMRLMMSDKEFTFDLQKVLNKLKENMEIHKKEFKELLEKNTAHVHKEIRELATQTEAYPDISKLKQAVQGKPVDHTVDYERLIAILSMTNQSEVTLTTSEFDRYMNDNWEWKETFTLQKTMYGMS